MSKKIMEVILEKSKCKDCQKFDKHGQSIYGEAWGHCEHRWLLIDGELPPCNKRNFDYMETWENQPYY